MTVQLLSHTNGVENPGKKNRYPGESVTETLTNGFFTVDINWTVKYWNKAAEKILGVQASDITGKNLWEKFAGTIPLEFYTVYHKAFLQDVPLHFEEYWGEMGAWFDVVTYHCDDTLSVSFKSSNHPHSEYPENPVQRLKILTELYRYVTEITNDCLWEWNIKTNELFWIDGGHKRIFGYQVENALIPKSFWESRVHPDDKVRILEKLNKCIGEGNDTTWEDEYRFQKANGDYAYVHDRGHIIYDADKKASRMIGATQDITERVLLENQLVEEQVKKQGVIIAAVLTAQENERAEIGKELHDNMNQILITAKMYIQIAMKNQKNRDAYLEKSYGLIVEVVEEMRKVAKKLVIADKNIIGLFDNIKNLVSDLVHIHPVKIEFHTVGITEEELDGNLQLNIFRIVQEQMTNILKHAKATHATIHLTRQENEMTLLIADNGKGCDTLEEIEGVGIINIKSRAELYHGNVSIISKPGEGYELKVVIPLNVPARQEQVNCT